MSLNCSGTAHGPQPEGLSWITGATNFAIFKFSKGEKMKKKKTSQTLSCRTVWHRDLRPCFGTSHRQGKAPPPTRPGEEERVPVGAACAGEGRGPGPTGTGGSSGAGPGGSRYAREVPARQASGSGTTPASPSPARPRHGPDGGGSSGGSGSNSGGGGGGRGKGRAQPRRALRVSAARRQRPVVNAEKLPAPGKASNQRGGRKATALSQNVNY